MPVLVAATRTVEPVVPAEKRSTIRPKNTDGVPFAGTKGDDATLTHVLPPSVLRSIPQPNVDSEGSPVPA